ncbi:MAG: phosphoribosylamine--glycine ligase [Myxococcota bacterium]|nr:phosphoribosylamine--glycine ligase [Myxococcota bacterium]
MKVLVVGAGGREHAIAWKLAQSARVTEVVVAPGNAGIAQVARCVAVAIEDVDAIVALAQREQVGLVVVGPEAPLTIGVADALRAAGIATFGPGAEAAQLEGSKVFAKERMAEAGIPTAAFRVFDDADAAEAYVRDAKRPLVVKADGLASGKGVIVAATTDEALAAIQTIMRDRAFGDAGARVVIEEVLRGPEVSYHVVCDGTRYVALAAAQDHKRLADGDQGPNTGGMGAYSPPPPVTPEIEAQILSRIVEPTLATMRARGTPLSGALFVGVMIVDGAPMVLEYNVRFGDPETEVLMARWKGDALPLFLGAASGDLSGVEATWDAPAALCVVLAAADYPGAPRKGDVIDGLADAASLPGVQVFHAGTTRHGDRVVTTGGRVLAVTAIGDDVDDAAARAYAAVDRIRFAGAQHRRDIGWQARAR